MLFAISMALARSLSSDGQLSCANLKSARSNERSKLKVMIERLLLASEQGPLADVRSLLKQY